MDLKDIERIVLEEVQKVLAERQRNDSTMLPPNQNETLDPNACRGPVCSMPQNPQPPAPSSTNRPPQPQPIQNPTASVLCVFTGAHEEWETITSAFASWREKGIALDAVFSRGAAELISSDELAALGVRSIDQPAELWQIIYDMGRYAAVFLPSVSRTHAAKLALGITDTVTLNLTLSALAQGVPTIASSDGLAPTACIVCGNNVPGIQEVLDKYREHLAKMGLKLLPAADAVKAIQRTAINKAESGPDLITTLVTEEDAAKLKGPVVKVARGGLLTPLAMESLYKRGIEVIIVPENQR